MNRRAADALLHEDLVVPVHAHDEARNRLVATVPGERPRTVTPEEAGRLVQHLRPTTGLHDVDPAPGGPRVGRRHLFRAGGIGLGALLAASSVPRFSFAADAGRDLLVVVFLRGGMDGLSAVVPVDDPAYHAARPKIGVRVEDAFALDGRYAMNDNLAALKPLWDAGDLAPVVGSGAPELSRSHFEDMALCERGAAPANVRSGWLGRHLATSSAEQGTFRAITIGNSATLSLAANFDTVAMNSIGDFDLSVWEGIRPQILRSMDSMYADVGGPATAAARQTLAAVDGLASLRGVTYAPEGGAVYPDSPFGKGLTQIAQVAKGGKGLEVACLDIGDWDMHKQLGRASVATDWYSTKARDLAEGLAALRLDLGERWATTTVVTMSEFGRRVRENGDRGLDHGTGNLMLVAGGSVNGGRVYGRLPSLKTSNLVQGDVPVTTDYRQALSEIVTKRLANGANVAQVFPGFTPSAVPLGIV